MYELFRQMSNLLTQPLMNMWRSTESIPILAAFILGLAGALAPCQFTSNLGAISLYGNQSIQKKIPWREVLWFTIGKIVVFSGLGLLVWITGTKVRTTLTLFFPWLRKLVGPILILMGLVLMGIIKWNKSLVLGKIPERFTKKGNTGAFLLGVSFTLGFCPTMFSLFFMALVPMAMTVPYGPGLPVVFAIGTSLPLIISIFVIWYLELDGAIMRKKGRRIGHYVQRMAGFFILMIGALDTWTYWS
ncbi:sulfite exporter TauE/SafE family protein [Mesobacillus foraminis]|uniref:urease accessory protein UreH domain-containing protein n=1 Tax=Mesobacillus foraminis TaxID=279826 RepID=UPI001BE94D8F|nr:sulfite exporter TauE/SafE family protein [Mesobacillus foraminis]MBT2758794.1 sulfite exporter TauE/SafE family protein [Mesobacillus foraminis]